MKRLWTGAFGLILLPATVSALGGVAVFQGPPAGVGSVGVYDETNGAALALPPALQEIQLLSVDFCGRTQLEDLLPGRPRLRSDVAGASRLALPNQQGSLYRFARATAQGGLVYGFMQVGREGSARSVLEVAGTGALGQDDPFVDRVAVSPQGDAFLAATRVDAGGNLLEVSLGDPAVAVDRSASSPPLRFSGAGLALTSTTGYGASTRGVWRFDRASVVDALHVSFAPDSPTFFSGELVTSRNGVFAATTAGDGPTSLHVYAFDGQGPARRATSAPAALSGAGFEPVAQDGPYLAVSDDGAWCAWRTEGLSREAFTGRTQPAAGEQPVQLSSNALFLDTLDEVGVLSFFQPAKLLLGVGEQASPGANALGKVDFFEVSLPAGGGPPSFVNLSLSSGDGDAPFLSVPQVELGRFALLPDQSGMIFHDDHGSSAPVYSLQAGQSGASVLIDLVKSLDLIEIAGRHMLLSVQKDGGTDPQELFRLPWNLSTAPALVASQPEATRFERTAPRRDGWIGYVTVEPSGAERLDRVHLANGASAGLPPTPYAYGPANGITALGSIAYSLGATGAPSTFAIWPFQGPAVVLQTPPVPGQILPGM